MHGHIRNLCIAAALTVASSGLVLGACGSDDAPSQAGPTPTGSGGSSSTASGGAGEGSGICLLNNCTEDAHCDGCADGRTTCLEAENRCVACDPNTGEGCADGEECSSFGLCVPSGLTCPTDNEGNPEVVCEKNSDCAACSPMHQVCDTTTNKCQACTTTNTQHCLESDMCLDGKCSPKCPASCDADNDCSQCGGPGQEAHACNAHECAECSDTYPCSASEECVNGVCTPPCGIPGPVSGDCIADEDCGFCGNPDDPTEWECKKPANADPGDHGTCIPVPEGCEDLGGAVLPDPYDDYTELCTDDSSCDNVNIQYNVGKALRDLLGDDEVGGVEITDANVEYPMPICAKVTDFNSVSCGICVPCRVDSDCSKIEILPLMGDIFSNDPLVTLVGAVLISALWGDENDPALHFFCQTITQDAEGEEFGACIPCGNPLQPCGDNNGGGATSGNCDGADMLDMEGDALDPTCNECVEKVCDADPYCCTTAWDNYCVDAAATLCSCHDVCDEGDLLDSSICTEDAACIDAVCAVDDFCCTSAWDDICVDEVEDYCDASFTCL